MRKFLCGLLLAGAANVADAQSVIQFDVQFDSLLEASGNFTPNLSLVQPGPFNNNQPLPPITVVGHVVLSVVPGTTVLTNENGAANRITLDGSFSTESGRSPSNGWSVHSFDNAVFDLYKVASYVAIDPATDPDNRASFTATSTNGALADHGPAVIYGGICPFQGGCLAAASAGTPLGTTPYDLFDVGTPIYNTTVGAPAFPPSFRNSGNYPLLSGTVSQTNASAGLGFENGMDAFAFQGVLDAANAQGAGAFQPYPDGVNGYPGIVRIITFSSTGNTAYVLQGKIVPTVPAPLPTGVWLVAPALASLAPWARRRRRALL